MRPRAVRGVAIGFLLTCSLGACAAGGPAPRGPGAGSSAASGPTAAPTSPAGSGTGSGAGIGSGPGAAGGTGSASGAGGSGTGASGAGAMGAGAVGAGAAGGSGGGGSAALSDSTSGRGSEVIARSRSMTTAPEVLAAGVGARQTVRVVAVRVSDGRAHVIVADRTGRAAAAAAIRSDQADAGIVAVQIDHRVHEAATAADDSPRSQQWALTRLQAAQVWSESTGTGQIIGEVDTGVDATHPDLAGQILAGTDEISSGDTAQTDPAGHGTHVAGIVAALGTDSGTEGLAPGAKILPVRALDQDGDGWDSDIASGVIWAVDHGATVVNLSLGGTDTSDTIRTAIQYAIGKGAVVVAAVGNERGSGNPIEYPAGYDTSMPGLIGVAATTSADVSASYSNSGADVTLAAPGDSILSTYPGDAYELMSGTSMATPYVAASVALLRSADPSLTPAQVENVLVATAQDLETKGRDNDTGAGLVDPLAALCSVGHCAPGVTASPTPTTTTTTTAPSTSTAGSALSVKVAAAAGPWASGSRVALTVTVTDADGPVAGATVTAASGDRSTHGVTGASGVARLVVAPVRTSTWTVTAAAPGATGARTTVVLTVSSRVDARWQGSRVIVGVSPAVGQLITVWTRGTHGWVRQARASLSSGSSSVTLPVPSASGAEVTVSAAAGLSAVTVRRS